MAMKKKGYRAGGKTSVKKMMAGGRAKMKMNKGGRAKT